LSDSTDTPKTAAVWFPGPPPFLRADSFRVLKSKRLHIGLIKRTINSLYFIALLIII
jgi:hypothetical protein